MDFAKILNAIWKPVLLFLLLEIVIVALASLLGFVVMFLKLGNTISYITAIIMVAAIIGTLGILPYLFYAFMGYRLVKKNNLTLLEGIAGAVITSVIIFLLYNLLLVSMDTLKLGKNSNSIGSPLEILGNLILAIAVGAILGGIGAFVGQVRRQKTDTL